MLEFGCATIPRMIPPTARALLLLPLLVGCNAAPSPAPDHSEHSEPSPSSEPGEAVPVIASDAPVFDFGTVTPADEVTHVFKLVNRGNADLHIERVERT